MERNANGGREKQSTRSDVVVVGNGPLGAATSRHLAEGGLAVTSIAAPVDDRTIDHVVEHGDPSRVYSSHNDRARLTRLQDRDERWAATTARAVANYKALEDASGIAFHSPVGCLISAPIGGDAHSPDPRLVMDSTGVAYTYFAPGDQGWRERWPDLNFPATHYVAYEPSPAGHVDPLAMIAAQNKVAADHGAQLVTGTAVDTTQISGGGWRVQTTSGRVVEADRLVVAAGAFSNVNGLLRQPVEVELKSEVIILGEVSERDAVRLATAPTVKYLVDSPDLEGIYMVGPLQYPDGRWYVKMGANTNRDRSFGDGPQALGDIQSWFESEPDTEYLPLYRPALQTLWPGLNFTSFTTRPCIITYSPDRYPLIEQVDDGVFVVVAGNGAGVKCSDALGQDAADLIMNSSYQLITG